MLGATVVTSPARGSTTVCHYTGGGMACIAMPLVMPKTARNVLLPLE